MVKEFNARVLHGGVVQPLSAEDERDKTGRIRDTFGGKRVGQSKFATCGGQGRAVRDEVEGVLSC